MRELQPQVLVRPVARLSLSKSILLLDLRLGGGLQFLASMDRSNPALYLAARTAAQHLTRKPATTPFDALLRKYLVGAEITKLSKTQRDRIVQLDFEKLDAGDKRVQMSLVLAFTGRSANASLVAGDGSILATLFDQAGPQKDDDSHSAGDEVSASALTAGLGDSDTESGILNRFFGAGSLFGPQLKDEFLARSSDRSAPTAFKSLIEDLFNRDPIPLVYSRLPLDQIEERLIDVKTDLLLSHIELAQAHGMLRYEFSTLSEAAEQYDNARALAMALRADYTSLKQNLAREITRRESAFRAIESDRARFEHPERLKFSGDLILANLANAQIDGTRVTVVDYYDPDQRQIQIDIPEGVTLQTAASGYFKRYQKARRALEAIDARSREVLRALNPLKQLAQRLDQDPTSESIVEISLASERVLGKKGGPRRGKNKRASDQGNSTLGRRFRSSDGYEIVVGRNDRDNEALTFRVARPHDIWMHAADYPGSHVIVRNPTRAAAPHRTIAEAAALAAFYSQAKREGKAAVHYSLKKFVSKPPRSKPGLVRLSSFKTILVEPRSDLERLG